MADQPPIRAELWELQPNGSPLPASRVPVQFNPETLKVSFANQVVPPSGGAGDQTSTSATQFVGKGTTKLSVQLWFDVTAVLPVDQQSETDVRKLTRKVAFFITPRPAENDPTKNVPPAVRFLWGTFQFDGIMESLEESLELFSAEGKPLRASLTLSLSQQNIQFAFSNRPTGGAGSGAGTGGPGASSPGTRPLAAASAGQSVQSMAAAAGRLGDWQAIAAANGIENPRQLQLGQLVDINVRVGGTVGLG